MPLDHQTRLEIGRLHRQRLRVSEIRTILAERGIKTTWQTVKNVIHQHDMGHFDVGVHNPTENMKIKTFQKLEEDDIVAIQDALSANCMQSSTDIQKHFQDRGTNVSKSTIKRAIAAADWTHSKPRYCSMIRDVNKQKRVEFCKELISTNDSLENVVFTDECTVQLHGNRVTCYRPRHATAVHVPVPKHVLKVHVWGGISKRGATQILIFDGIMRKEFFVTEILEGTLKPFLVSHYPEGGRFQQDNDPKHTSRLAKQYLADNNINTITWPSGLCIYLSNAQRGHQRGNSHGPPQHQNNNHGPPPHQNTNSHGPPPSHRMSNSHGPPPSHRMSNSHGPPPTHKMVNSHGPSSQGGSHQLSSGHHIGKNRFYHVTKNVTNLANLKFARETTTKFVKDNNESAVPTDIPEEKEIGEDPTTSADGLTQRTESPHGTDPIEQRDPVRTTPMSVPRGRAGGALPPPPPPRNSVGGHSRGVQYHAPTYPPTHAPRHRPRPRPKPTTRKDPIVHARTTTPEPPKPTEAGEVEYENEGGSTTVGYQGGGRGGGGGGRRNQRRNQQGGGGYYNDYYNYHDPLFHKMMQYGAMDLLGFCKFYIYKFSSIKERRGSPTRLGSSTLRKTLIYENTRTDKHSERRRTKGKK
ncbi:hypothetical protein FSP39_019917 [Pinctada imbricata]|uniref:Transposase Tc1-like domain-containing protein n=1 Tax=Pinctada imbricata TaxID=66713 RepID=A0AA89CDH7_PINIB|nr:hypothetical protein FSP39_019917 [Pinctada imbricata]